MADSLATSGSALLLVQALASSKAQQAPSLWLVTRGAQPAGDAVDPPALGQATLWGTGKVIAREYPEIWGGMLDLDPVTSPDDASLILDEIRFPDGEDHIAYRSGRRLAARLARCAPAPNHASAVRADATYLITGGCGALGLQTASWLVEQGGRHLALVSRGGAATEAAREAIAALEQRGATVRVFRADVADEAAVTQVLDDIRTTGFPLRGVIHAAGVPGRRSIAELDLANLEQMFAAKVAGTWVLHRSTSGSDLDFFVCFSSMVSLWGAKEQCHYVAANHFMDVLAHYRRAQSLPALCVNWGPLGGGGMLAVEHVAELKRIGVTATPMKQATSALTQLLGSDVVQAAVIHIDWPLFQSVYQSRGPCRIFELVASRPHPEDADPAPPQSAAILERLRSAPENDRREILLAHLQSTIGRILGVDAGYMTDRQQGFFDMGMDSLTAMEVRSKLQASLAVSLPATLAFDYGTLDALADFLLRGKLDLERPTAGSYGREIDDRSATTREMIERMSEAEAEVLLEAKLLTL
jgi:NADP-dependent 3-hydroxy acid dehydrogenase YdfG/acyl carrier protein